MVGDPLETISGSHGEYRLDGVLGEGGFATVYSATMADGRPLAIKLLHGDRLGERSLERFRKEVGALERLDHPHIARILDAGMHRGRPFLVMERVAGDSLETVLERTGPLPMETVREMLVAIGAALGHAHARGVIHRDVTPANLLRSDGTWWLIDFGLALETEGDSNARLTSSGIIVGTSTYMSPEQVAGSRRIDARSDQYSLACVAYHALAGVPPFQGGSPQATRAMRLHVEAPDLRLHRPGISPGAAMAIARALSREPADRFESVSAFVAAFGAPAAPVWARRTLTRRRLPWVFMGAAAVLAALLTIPFGEERTDAAANPRDVAVLFFDDLTPERSLGWLSRGLTSDLIHDLSALDTLTVVSLSGVQPFRSRELSSDSIARELAVGTVVDGTVRRVSQGRLEVTVRLIDASNGYRVQSIRIVKAESEIAALQDEMLFEISSYLREHVGRAGESLRRRQTAPRVEAWRSLQKGAELMASGWDLGRRGEAPRAWQLFGRADSLFAEAGAMDPRWVEPVIMRARLARAQFLSISSNLLVPGQRAGPGGDVDLALERVAVGLGRAKRAAELAPLNAEAGTLRAYFMFTRWVLLGQREQSPERLTAKAELEDIVARDETQALAWILLSRLYQFEGDVARSDAAAQRAYSADPFLHEGRRAMADLIRKHLERGRVVDARSLCASARTRYRDQNQLAECHLEILGWTASARDSISAGWRELAAIEASGAPGLETGWMMRRMFVAAIAARAGLADSARAIVARSHARTDRERSDSVRVAMAEAWIATLSGDRDQAVHVLDSLLSVLPDQRARLANHPWFAPLRQLPRYQTVMRPRTPQRSPAQL